MGRWLLIVLLGIATLSFGAASLCGGYFTLWAALDHFRPKGEDYAFAIWIFSLPSLLIGGWLCWLVGRLLRKLWPGAKAHL
jgi:hypothetical protein